MTLMTLTLALLACGKSGDDDSGPPGPQEQPALDYVEAARNYSTHDAEDYVISDWVLGPRAEDPYASLFEDELPFFYLIHPADMEPDEELPVLLWLHGGTIADDSGVPDGLEFPDPCRQDNVESFVWKSVSDPSFVPEFMSERRWVMIAPRNDWCDYYQGLGPDDPIDPERHFGYYHTRRVLDYVLEGNAGFQHNGELYGWGTSAGAGAVTSVAHRYGGFDGILFDSGLSSTITYWEITEQPPFEHIFGGPPYDEAGEPNGEIYDRYAASSPYLLIEEQGFRVPMFVAWNNRDEQVEAQQIYTLLQTLDQVYNPEGVRFGSHDYDHSAPGTTFHVQSMYGPVPWGYGTRSYVDFLAGSNLNWQEAEEGCPGTCPVGELVTGPDYANFSAETVVKIPAGTAGLAYEAAPSEALIAGTPAEARLVMQANDIEALADDAEIGTLSFELDGDTVSATFTAGSFLSATRTGDEAIFAQTQATVLPFTPGEPGEGTLRFESTGAAEVLLDALILVQ